MRRLGAVLGLLLAAIGLYALAFACVLDRPLSLGTLRRALDAKLAYAAGLPGPKLVILAGSNALFSHSCAVIGGMLALPCVNGGVAQGLGLDYQFALWKPRLHAGDIVYMPMELQQYVVTAGAGRAGPDAAIMLRHDRATLAGLGAARIIAAVFSSTAEDAVLSLVEAAALAAHPAFARAPFAETDRAGDGIGHGLARAAANRAFLAALHRADPAPAAIAAGHGAAEIARFLDWARGHGLRVIGGWPTEFADALPDPRLPAALAGFYRAHGAAFLPLPGKGRYPRADFFDSQDHLATECQARHSIAVALGLAPLLGRPTGPPPAAAAAEAARCPRMSESLSS
jgi:hypothetical protein